MTSRIIFFIGVGIDAFAILLSVYNSFLIYSPLRSSDGTLIDTSESLTDYGKMMAWLIPLGLLAWIGVGFWLRSIGRTWIANIAVWIPALPFLIAILICAWLAVLFILLGN